MRKALFLLAFVLGGVAFALTVGSKAASASVLPPLISQERSATNTNSTGQDAAAEATTKQANLNLPVSVLSWGSNGGDVDQSNSAGTQAYADNDNNTDQSVDQGQQAEAGSRGTSHAPKSASSGIDQDQSASNDNSTDQGADAKAGTRQLNVNAPVSVLSWGSNGGDVDQSNDATTTAGAKNANGTDQSVDQDQQAASKGSGTGGIDQSQDATNGNETSQQAGADASTKQANVNVPVSILSWGSNGGDVDQTNTAKTGAYADNDNRTDQKVDQDQGATIVAPAKPEHGHGEYPKPPHHGPKPCGCEGHYPGHSDYPKPPNHGPKPCGCEGQGPKEAPGSGSIDQTQTGSNDNYTDQRAESEATTKQANVNAPISVLSWGANNGDVDQANYATTIAGASNSNGTDQSVNQGQKARVDSGPAYRPPQPSWKPTRDCGCSHPTPVSEPAAAITQTQSGSNANHTTQSAYADATTEQKNVNRPFTFLSWGDDPGTCGCGGHDGYGKRDGGVRQDNDAATIAYADNANATRQTVDQLQEALIGRR